MHCYIYYRIDVKQEAQLRQELQALSQRLDAGGWAPPKVLRKLNGSNTEIASFAAPSSGQPQTWMEIYHDVDKDFLQHLQKLITPQALPLLSACQRHIEQFEPIA